MQLFPKIESWGLIIYFLFLSLIFDALICHVTQFVTKYNPILK